MVVFFASCVRNFGCYQHYGYSYWRYHETVRTDKQWLWNDVVQVKMAALCSGSCGEVSRAWHQLLMNCTYGLHYYYYYY